MKNQIILPVETLNKIVSYLTTKPLPYNETAPILQDIQQNAREYEVKPPEVVNDKKEKNGSN